ncbi:hypothetical protein VAEKB19_3230169 [Vibrio aestuarianus]|nr:hypothetical protein VAEKB19_3230169 [Vibrio aestuarianus]
MMNLNCTLRWGLNYDQGYVEDNQVDSHYFICPADGISHGYYWLVVH